MALLRRISDASDFPGRIDRHTDESAAATALTVIVPSGTLRQILLVTAKYSASETKNITITIDSGAGASWDSLLETITLAPATEGIWIPDSEIFLSEDDTLDVVAAAGEAGVTVAVAVYSRVF